MLILGVLLLGSVDFVVPNVQQKVNIAEIRI